MLTDDAFARMIELGARFAQGVRGVIDAHGTPWSVIHLGARAEYRFCPEPPRTGGDSAAAADEELDELSTSTSPTAGSC